MNLPSDNGFTPHDGESLSVSLHASYAPPIAAGDTTGGASGTEAVSPPSIDSSRRYFVSVMPYGGAFNMSGAPVVFSPATGTPSSATATIALSPLPLPTSQISVLCYEDKFPLNDEDETPEERGLAGFNIQVLDAAGTLGDSGGLLSNDAFGHKIGTTYKLIQNPDNPTDPNDLVPDMSCGGPCVLLEGTGIVTTDADGKALIKFLPPGRWGVLAIPPAMPPARNGTRRSRWRG